MPTKVHINKAMVFSVVMNRCESWMTKKVEFQRIDAFELWFWRRLLRVPWKWSSKSPLQGDQTVSPKGNQSWVFIGRTDAEVPILWSPDVKSQHIGKDLDAGKGWRQEEKEMIEDEMVGWHPRLSGHEFEQTPGDIDEQRTLAYCSSLVTKSQTRLTTWATTTQHSNISL